MVKICPINANVVAPDEVGTSGLFNSTAVPQVILVASVEARKLCLQRLCKCRLIASNRVKNFHSVEKGCAPSQKRLDQLG